MPYDAGADPYCYAGTTVLKNIPGIRDAVALQEYETAVTLQRSDEHLPQGRYSVRHYCAIHRHLFQDVYRWAGRFRTVRVAKGTSVFCYPENIRREMNRSFRELRTRGLLRGLSAENFALGAALFLCDLNAIHPFRDGNGRTQMTFLAVLADSAAHPLDFSYLDPDEWMAAMIVGFHGRPDDLALQIRRLIQV